MSAWKKLRAACWGFKRLVLFVAVLPIAAFALVGVDSLSDESTGASKNPGELSSNAGGFVAPTRDFTVFLKENGGDAPETTPFFETFPIVDDPGAVSGGGWSMPTNLVFATPPNLSPLTFEEMMSSSGSMFGNGSSSGDTFSYTTLSFGPGGFPFVPGNGAGSGNPGASGGPGSSGSSGNSGSQGNSGGPGSSGGPVSNVSCEMPDCNWQELTKNMPNFTSEPPTSDVPGTQTDAMGWPLGPIDPDATQPGFDEPTDSVPEPMSVFLMGAGLAALIKLARTKSRRS